MYGIYPVRWFVGGITQKVTGGFGRNFQEKVRLEVIRFWWWSGSASGCRIGLKDSLP